MSRRLFRVLTPILCLAGLAGQGLAQGADDCSAATPISGFATFNVTTVGATDSTQQSGCPTAHNDVWFKWTSPATQTVELSMCSGGISTDTVVAIYNGSTCPVSGTQIACNDDSCAYQSRVQFSAVSGNTYMLQMGAYNAGQTYTGTFTVGTPPPCSPSIGPDVIVGDLNGVENETAAGVLDAISLGTTSCNIGTANVNWIANNNLHPAIGGNLYRYRVVGGSGRFEQIGQSWLKHGFTALTGSLCCVCSGQGGAVLGVGCSDPYTAGRNGSQSGLGPRYQVNAHTGVFTYPPASGTGGSGSTYRRCEFLQSDVDLTAGVRYFGESQYITQDDATAGNQNNNSSYRELSVSGGPTDFTFAFAGATQRLMSAIRAWPTAEAGVTLNDVQVAGDGLYVVGFKTTSLGAGQYHYEYAIYNMNGDRNCGSFSIPIGAGVVVTNIDFHDVTYRNGDGNGNVNFTGTDWVGSVSGGALTWACDTQGVNANANAIRWGTTYNFRFDANVAPATGSATLGLWKTGSPAAVTTNVDVPGAGSTNFAFCFGDGSGTVCPCANDNSPGSGTGCLNSLGQGGLLAATGNASISSDTLVLQGSGMPNSSALYFQGTTQQSGGAGSVFGDGKRCAAGTVIRLGTKSNVAGASAYPVGGDLTVSVKGADAAGNVRTYQCWYRNAAAFCNPETFNLTNGYQVTWAP